MNKSATAKVVLASVLLAGAVVCFIKLSPARPGQAENAYFYDLAEQKLFLAPRGSIPPIQGMKGAAEPVDRAVVISAPGDPSDTKHRQLADLQSYAPETNQL